MTKREQKVIDITGAPCHKCGKGEAFVVYFVTKNGKDRWFFGCNASTETEPCKGLPEWNGIIVPADLCIVPADYVRKSRQGPKAAKSARAKETNPEPSRKRGRSKTKGNK